MSVVNEVVLSKITHLSGLVEYYLMKLDSMVSQPFGRYLSMFIRSCREEADVVSFSVQSINRAYRVLEGLCISHSINAFFVSDVFANRSVNVD